MRTRALIVAAATTLSVLAAAPASAATDGSEAPAPVKKERVVKATGKDGGGNLRVIGKVKGDPTYANKITTLQKKECQTCRWSDVRSQRTNDNAKVTYKVGVPPNDVRFFRVKVPATAHYKTGLSNVLRACSGSAC